MVLSAEQKVRAAANKVAAQKKRASADAAKKSQPSVYSFFQKTPSVVKSAPLVQSADAVEPQKKKLFASPGSGHEKAGATSASPIAEKPLAEAAKLDATSASPTFSSSTTSPAMSAARPATAAVVAPARVFDGANKPFDSDSDDEGPARRRVVRKAALQKRVHSFDESDDSGSNSDAPSVARTSITKKKAKRSAAPDSDESEGYAPDVAELKSAAAEDQNFIDDESGTAESSSEVEDDLDAIKAKYAGKKTATAGAARKSKVAAKPSVATFGSKSEVRLPGVPRAVTGISSLKGSHSTSALGINPVKGRHSWLADPRDSKMRRPGDPDYDPSTLWVPPIVLTDKDKNKTLTPFERQYFSIKKDLWDTVLFFKKGKFYELYECDADVGHSVFNLVVTDRVNMRMVGVPESKFEDWCQKFIDEGYKVARADERENSLARDMREAKSGIRPAAASKKIIERHLTMVLTPGTLSGNFLTGDLSNYIMAIRQEASQPGTYQFGICFADVGTAEFSLTYIEDDSALTQLETLLVQIKPKELVIERGGLGHLANRLLKTHSYGAQVNKLEPGTEFLEPSEAVEHLRRMIRSGTATGDGGGGGVSYSALSAAVERHATTDNPGGGMILSAMSALVWYFKKLLIDADVLSQGSFEDYSPLQHGRSLILDGQTLQNLEVLENNIDRSTEGTLLDLLCHTRSSFGKRAFRKLLCHPLRDVDAITRRLDSVDELQAVAAVREPLQRVLKEVPDLERLVSLTHQGKCTLEKFLTLLAGFEKVNTCMTRISDEVARLSSPRLKELLTISLTSEVGASKMVSASDENEEVALNLMETEPSKSLGSAIKSKGIFPDLVTPLAKVTSSFNRRIAEDEKRLCPMPGSNMEYDECEAGIARLETQLERELVAAQRALGAREGVKSEVKYFHPGVTKERYQVQVPNALCKKVPTSWTKKSSTSTCARFWPREVEDLQRPLAELIETKEQILRAMMKTLQLTFDESIADWNTAIRCLAEVDCLLSLALAKERMGSPMCRPTFVPSRSGPVFEVEEMRHPCLVDSVTYIPNDTVLGGNDPAAVILTGPNMGGKSTLLRQTCMAVILAQIGAYVPCKRLALSPVDRIFTRIGANDNIIAGRSTFMVELKETATILNHATQDSLVILDELGRGTSTFDGYSIAAATLSHLIHTTGCRTLFATHYHALADEYGRLAQVGLKHMACKVDDAEARDVTFLYKLLDGVCSKSYGLNVARMAGVPDTIIDKAQARAANFELQTGFGGGVGTHARQFLELKRTLSDANVDFSRVQALLEGIRAGLVVNNA